MFQRFAIAALVTLGASLCAVRASAQTATVVVPFNGSISGICSFSNTSAGTLDTGADPFGNSGLIASPSVGLPATTTLSCNTASTLSVNNPVPTSIPSGVPNTSQSASVRRTGETSFACSSGTSNLVLPGCNGATNLSIAGDGAKNYQIYMSVIATNGGILPAGSYAYGVTLTASTP